MPLATCPALSTMMLVSCQMLAIDFPAPMKSAAEARHTNASNRVYSTKSWPSSARTNCFMNSCINLFLLSSRNRTRKSATGGGARPSRGYINLTDTQSLTRSAGVGVPPRPGLPACQRNAALVDLWVKIFLQFDRDNPQFNSPSDGQ